MLVVDSLARDFAADDRSHEMVLHCFVVVGSFVVIVTAVDTLLVL